MTVRQQLALFLLVAPLACGCRTTANDRCERAIALLRAEKLDLEDRYYALEDEYRRATGRDYRQNHILDGAVISEGGIQYESSDSDPQWRPPGGDSNEELFPPLNVETPNGDESSFRRSSPRSGSTNIPEIIIDTGEFSVVDSNIGIDASAPVGPTLNLPSPTHPSPNQPRGQHSPNAYDRELASYIADLVVEQPETGDSASWLIVQPIDERGNALPLSGHVTIKLVDPSGIGNQQQVGAWSYDPNQIENWVRDRDGDVPGIHLPLPNELLERDLQGLIMQIRYRSLAERIFEVSVPLNRVADASASADEAGEVEWRPRR